MFRTAKKEAVSLRAPLAARGRMKVARRAEASGFASIRNPVDPGSSPLDRKSSHAPCSREAVDSCGLAARVRRLQPSRFRCCWWRRQGLVLAGTVRVAGPIDEHLAACSVVLDRD